MMLGARTGAWAKSGGGVPTAKDYVQDGLIAMWDGIENAGWGTHTENTPPKNLVGSSSLDAVAVGSVLYGDDYFQSNSASNYFYASFNNNSPILTAAKNKSILVEMCVEPVGYTKFGNRCPFSIEDSNGTSSVYRFAQVFQREDGSYRAAWFNVKGTDFSGKTPTIGLSANTLAFAVENNISSAYAGGVLGESGTMTYGTTIRFDPSLIDTLASEWFIRFGRTHNNSMSMKFHNVRIYNLSLTGRSTVSVVAANYAIDKARFNLP